MLRLQMCCSVSVTSLKSAHTHTHTCVLEDWHLWERAGSCSMRLIGGVFREVMDLFTERSITPTIPPNTASTHTPPHTPPAHTPPPTSCTHSLGQWFSNFSLQAALCQCKNKIAPPPHHGAKTEPLTDYLQFNFELKKKPLAISCSIAFFKHCFYIFNFI